MTLSHPHLIRRQISLDDYHKMIEAGILTEEDKVELIEGDIIHMSPKGSKHASCIRKILTWLPEKIATSAQLQIQDSIQIPDVSEPEPDLALAIPRADYYVHTHPLPEEILLVIEVADSSLSIDREIKLPLYAAAGIPEYWIINLRDRQIEVHRKPSGKHYLKSQILNPGEQLLIPSLGIETAVADWLV